jgi:hypothetical protein
MEELTAVIMLEEEEDDNDLLVYRMSGGAMDILKKRKMVKDTTPLDRKVF